MEEKIVTKKQEQRTFWNALSVQVKLFVYVALALTSLDDLAELHEIIDLMATSRRGIKDISYQKLLHWGKEE